MGKLARAVVAYRYPQIIGDDVLENVSERELFQRIVSNLHQTMQSQDASVLFDLALDCAVYAENREINELLTFAATEEFSKLLDIDPTDVDRPRLLLWIVNSAVREHCISRLPELLELFGSPIIAKPTYEKMFIALQRVCAIMRVKGAD